MACGLILTAIVFACRESFVAPDSLAQQTMDSWLADDAWELHDYLANMAPEPEEVVDHVRAWGRDARPDAWGRKVLVDYWDNRVVFLSAGENAEYFDQDDVCVVLEAEGFGAVPWLEDPVWPTYSRVADQIEVAGFIARWRENAGWRLL